MDDPRTHPDIANTDERAALNQFLDYHRETLLWKCDGLNQQQLAMTTAASSLTLAGLLKHMAVVEDGWFRVTLLGEQRAQWWRDIDGKADPDWDFRSAVDDDADWLRSLYRDTCAASREAAATIPSLDTLSVGDDRPWRGHFSLRWIMLHMIEETARHNGHADLLREAIDGVTGD